LLLNARPSHIGDCRARARSGLGASTATKVALDALAFGPAQAVKHVEVAVRARLEAGRASETATDP
jgi:hypothetical protein